MSVARFADLDVTSPDFFARPDFYDVLRQLRANAPVCRSGSDTWMVTRYEDIRAISRDPSRFISARGAIINDSARKRGMDLSSGSVIHMDPPEHAVYRKLVNSEFTPRAVGRMEAAVRATVQRVLDNVPAGEEIDAVAALTGPIPVLVIANLLGVSDGDLADFQRWSDAMIEFSDAPSRDGHESGLALFAFFDRHIMSRYEQPGDDLISLLTAASVDGVSLTREQILMFCLTLLVAGNETTRHLLSGSLLALWEQPSQRTALVNRPELLPGAVEEMLRWVTPIQAMARTAVSDMTFAGQDVGAGDYLVMLYASGNRDEAIFGPTADRFDISRPVSPAHVAFGFGEHLCLGASLARLEARLFFELLLARYPAYEIPGRPVWTRSTLVHGPVSMPIVLR